jgi:hypothetical protein
MFVIGVLPREKGWKTLHYDFLNSPKKKIHESAKPGGWWVSF